MTDHEKALIGCDSCLHLIDILKENDMYRGTRTETARRDIMTQALIIERELKKRD